MGLCRQALATLWACWGAERPPECPGTAVFGAVCPDCQSALHRLARVCTIHVTGDERLVILLRCNGCGRHYLNDWVEVGGWDDTPTEVVDRLFGPLDPAGAEQALSAMQSCPDPNDQHCDCLCHGALDRLIDRLPCRGVEAQEGR